MFQKGNTYGSLTASRAHRIPTLSKGEQSEVNGNWGRTILQSSRLLRTCFENPEILKMYMMPAGLETMLEKAIKVMAHYMPKAQPDVQVNQQINIQNNLTQVDLDKVIQLAESKSPSSMTQESTVVSTVESRQLGDTQTNNLSSCVHVELSPPT